MSTSSYGDIVAFGQGMDGLQHVTLDERGRAYVRAQLTLDTVLCTALLRSFDREAAEIFTYLPRDTPREAVYNFTQGGILRENLDPSRLLKAGDGWLMPVASLDRARAARIREYLKANPNACCIVDDVQARSGDRFLANCDTVFCVGEEVYHLLTPSEGADRVEQTVRGADAIWHGVAAVCTPTRRYGGSDLSHAAGLSECIGAVQEITVGAYDAEGFIIWKRRS